MSLKYYIIAGEASGDLHGSNLIKELKHISTDTIIRCWGGDKMQTAGGELVKHYRDLAFMGFSEVLKNLPTIFRNLSFCKNDITAFNPDAIILIDYPGFNLRIAEWAKAQGYKIIYYISPQVWAWKENRVKLIKRCVDKMLVILPFEKDFYKKWQFNVEYVGHPLVQVIQEFNASIHNEVVTIQSLGGGKKIIGILPGSRKQELKIKLPIMLQVAEKFPSYQFIVGKAPGIEDDFYNPFLEKYQNVSSVRNATYELLQQCTAAMVTSGTATLETALFKVPQVVCYKGNSLSYEIAKRIIKIKYISLVNLIMDKLVITELIQNDLTVANLIKEVTLLLDENGKRNQVLQDYDQLENLLVKGGDASKNAAISISQFMLANDAKV
ncbi:MAG: lipid-A-disaccharide synthase [Ginsengibacter sp.]